MTDILVEESVLKGWALATISELIAHDGLFIDGDWIESKDQDPDGQIRLIQLADIGDGEFKNKSERFLTYQKAKELGCTFLKQGDILIARMPAPLGRACIFPLKGEEKYVAAVDVCIVRLGSNLMSAKYLSYLINSPDSRKKIESYQKGSTRKRVSRGNLAKIRFPIPPIKQQYQIVATIEELFSELDNGIKNLKIARDQIEVYKHAVIQFAFEGKLTEQWRNAQGEQLNNADELLAVIKEKLQEQYQKDLKEWKQAVEAWQEAGKKGVKPHKPQKPKYLPDITKQELVKLPLLPYKWCWVKLSFIAENIQIGPFGSLLHKSDYITNGTPLINPSHIKNQRIFPDWDLSVSPEKLSELSNFIMRNGDIVIGRRGEMGRCAVVTQKEDGFLCGTGSLFIRLIPENNSDFYCYVLSSQRVKDFLSDQSIGTTMQNLNQEIIHNVPIPLCTFSEQQKIVEEIESKMTLISELENIIEENLQKAEVLRQSILKKAFSGHLVLPDPNDEPASILLERIRTERETTPKPIRKTLKNKNKKDIATMPNLISVIESAENWLSAKDVFRQCGISENGEEMKTGFVFVR
jgi:type I restriction enzyme S subunit